MTALWIGLAIIAGVIVGGVIVLLLFTAAIHYAIGRGLGW